MNEKIPVKATRSMIITRVLKTTIAKEKKTFLNFDVTIENFLSSSYNGCPL